MWADREWVYEVSDSMRLENWQKLNHFRNGRELCRKDLLVKNLKRKKVPGAILLIISYDNIFFAILTLWICRDDVYIHVLD